MKNFQRSLIELTISGRIFSVIGGAYIEGQSMTPDDTYGNANSLEICIDRQSHPKLHQAFNSILAVPDPPIMQKIQDVYVIQHVHHNKTLLFAAKNAALITQQDTDDVDAVIYYFFVDNPGWSINGCYDDCIVLNKKTPPSEVAKAHLNNKRIIIDRL